MLWTILYHFPVETQQHFVLVPYPVFLMVANCANLVFKFILSTVSSLPYGLLAAHYEYMHTVVMCRIFLSFWYCFFCRMASEMFLYWGSGSPPCWRVMLVLEEKGLSGYPNKLLSFEKKEHKSEEVLKWNPRGQVYWCWLLLLWWWWW